ncbi:fatty acid synthase [Sabethes cyaneus]|uniref:fatty acid synthase n=1 Tax=Sabethes cyaneus TaxID=53552 RepID=UPI00237E3BFF|nr:fatty acid synthase [Sabethes cyaneus]
MSATIDNPAIEHRARPPPPGEEIVISGLAGRFPNSDSVKEFGYHLYNKIDMVDDQETRWRHSNVEIPRRMGKINNLEKFDATFFGVHFKQAHTMDPQCRILVEHAYEAVIDAGVNPKTLRGSRTGVFVGACFAESEKTWFYEKISSGGFGITGCSRAMMANRISYTMGLNGPSFLLDTACSSSMYALDCAFNSIRNGECDAAIVGGSNLLLHPYVTLQFARLGVLASDGYCRPFDKDASGYTRSEAIAVVYLQKAKDAKRVYANFVYSKTNCDGFKEEGITYPSGLMQRRLLAEFYQEIKIDPSTVNYVEAHSTGTVVGDPEECAGLDKIFCTGRKKPLPVGSVKSNIGHSESTSGICSVTKSVLAFENKLIPPNINFTEIRRDIPSLVEGRLHVVSEVMPLDGPLIAINSFGFGGANAHALLKGNAKDKVNHGIPEDNLPRLITWSGRTEEAIDVVLTDMSNRHLDAEYVALVHNVQSESIPGNVFRGYGVYAKNGTENALCLGRDCQHYTGLKRPLVWVFSGMGSQWTEMGSSLIDIPIFRSSIERSHKVLEKRGLNLMEILTSKECKYENILHSFVGIAAVQIGIVDVLRSLDIEPDYVIGHSVGELGCAYADGCFTAEQMILSAYSRGMASLETKTVFGSMAAVGLGYRKIRTMLPSGIEVACHNGPDSCTISGPKENVEAFVKELTGKGIFAKEVPCSNIPYHSKYIAEMGPRLLARLNEVIPEPKKRSAKWLSSSVPKIRWDQTESQYSSAHYHTNNLLSSVLFEETSALLPNNAMTIEIAPHGLLQAILKKSMPNAVHIGLTKRGNKDNVQYLFNALGKLYVNGLDIPVSRLYPAVQFPVSRGTPMLSHLVRWDHNEDWFVTKFEMQKSSKSGERRVKIKLSDQDYSYIAGHVIDGRVLFPATAYLHLAWETLAMVKGPMYFDLEVEYEDVKFLRATSIAKDQEIEFHIMLQPGTGRFEISEGSAAVVTGYIKHVENIQLSEIPDPPESDYPMLYERDFYKELRLRGYHYNGAFRSIKEARADARCGKVNWELNWVSFLDCLLQCLIVGKDTRSLMIPTGLERMRIDPKMHLAIANTMDEGQQVFDFKYSDVLNTIRCGGIEIIGLQASTVGRRKPPGYPVLESFQFIPHLPAPKMSKSDAVRVCVQLALENIVAPKVKAVEVDFHNDTPITPMFAEALGDLPLVTADLMFLSQQQITLSAVHVEDGKLSTQSNCLFLISVNCLSRPELIEEAASCLHDSGFILSREAPNLALDSIVPPAGYQLIAVIPVENETYVMLQRIKRKYLGSPTIVHLPANDDQYQWITKLRDAIKQGSVIVVSQGDSTSGIIGLVNCIRKEPDGGMVSCVFVDDPKAPPFELDNPIYKVHLKLGLAINVYRNGRWGTYRHLQLLQPAITKPRRDHCYANALTKGDLSSLTWLSGPFNQRRPKGELVRVSYSSLNFRDVMFASGKLSADFANLTRIEQQCELGFEYSGIGETGRRIMGMVTTGAMATHVECEDTLNWTIPDRWTLEEAATIPVVYTTVYCSLFVNAHIQKGQSILIHAGSGGVGLAAINVCLAYGLEVYTTVGSQAKRDFLLQTFPKLKADNIGNSRDTSFEKMVMYRTDGKGVDYVLNSLADDKLHASLRCLGKYGKFLEIGKYDMANDTKLGLNRFLRALSFTAVLVDFLFTSPLEEKLALKHMIEKDIQAGIIVPLKSNVFPASEIEQAFRYLASGKHVGKVLLKVRENPNDEESVPIAYLPRMYCNPDHSYVIAGGLGGFGLELADWLVLRGCRKLVMSSSRGISKAYQAYRIKIWEQYGVKIIINTENIATRKGCEALLVAANKLGPVGGIYNLAVLLRDGIFENQTVEKFAESMGPKALATKHLDELSRKLCPRLEYFIVFSSVSCGRGNAGQSNYGMANSVMERIIEHRYACGLPAKAIQWGAVGEVGLVADMQEDKLDMEIGGTLQQRISSCLQELDPLLTTPDPIVASMVVAEKRVRSSGKDNIIESVMNIMSIRDIKSVSMDTTLSELGMDSLMAVEIKQTLEREYELFLTPQDLRSLTFMKLQELTEAKAHADENVKLKLANEKTPTGVAMLLRNLGDEFNSEQTILRLQSENDSKKYNACVLLTPGIEGVAGNAWHSIAGQLTLPTFITQLTNTINMTSVAEICQFLASEVVDVVFKGTEHFFLVGYSFGAFITLELARILEETGKRGQILLIDGAPKFLHKLAIDQMSENWTEESIQIVLIAGILNTIFPEETTDVLPIITECTSFESRIDKLLELAKDQNVYSENYLRMMTKALFNRIKITLLTDISKIEPLESPITLVRPTEVSVVDIEEDYGLSEYTKGNVSLKFLEGNHITMLENPKLTQIITESDPVLESDRSFQKYLQSSVIAE